MQDVDEMFTDALGKARKKDRSVAARAVKESRPIPYSERRKRAPKSERTDATYFKFATSFKQHLIAISIREGIPMVEVIERAVEMYGKREEQ